MQLQVKQLNYLTGLYGKARVTGISELGLPVDVESIKGFGYGKPYLIDFESAERKDRGSISMRNQKGFGHDHFSDRAQILIWQNSVFNNMPACRSLDVDISHKT